MSENLRTYNQQATQLSRQHLAEVARLHSTDSAARGLETAAADTLLELVVPDLSEPQATEARTTASSTAPRRSAGRAESATGQTRRSPSTQPPNAALTDAYFTKEIASDLQAWDDTARTYELRTVATAPAPAGGSQHSPPSGTRPRAQSEREDAAPKPPVYSPEPSPAPREFDVSEPPEQWTTPPASAPDSDRRQVKLRLVGNANFREENPQLIERMVAKQAALGCQLFMICDVDQGARSAGIAIEIGLVLGEKTGKQVLILDSDTVHSQLTQQLLKQRSTGLTDVLRGELQDQEIGWGTECPAVDFLPAGYRPLDLKVKSPVVDANAEQLVGVLKKQYDFVLVTTGTAFDSSVPLWSRWCDASYLTLDPTATSRSLAKAAVDELRRLGSRVDGCITHFARSPQQSQTR